MFLQVRNDDYKTLAEDELKLNQFKGFIKYFIGRKV